jgi:quercetin dioxygenase-like cupin family protein
VLEQGCRFIECLNRGEVGDVDATYIQISAAGRTRPHRHKKSRCFIFVVDGHAVMHLNGVARRVALNVFVLIEPGVVHSIEAPADEDAILFCLHSPAISADGGADVEYCDRAKSS